jgi:poly-gamma-glutamate synthesis protein (capsule biosynthesis protein)
MNSVKLSAVGDILLSGTVTELIKNEGAEGPFIFIIDELRKSDILFGNLECPLSNRGSPLKNKCCLYSQPETLKSLKSAGFNMVSLANNHIFDYGYESFEDTISLLKENNISWFGAGKKLEEARTPVILSINNISIGFLGYSWDFIGSINATENKFGTAPLSEKLILNDVKKLKEKVDVVIVSLHWCYEREKYPLPSQRKLAHKIIDAGANLILGHHPHVLQGIEEYNGGVIVYSLGNFIFPDISYKQYKLIQKPENKEALIFSCGISKNGIEGFEIIPVKANNQFQPVMLESDEKGFMLEKIDNLAAGFRLQNYPSFWKVNRIRKDLPDMAASKTFNIIIYKGYQTKVLCKGIIRKYKGII